MAGALRSTAEPDRRVRAAVRIIFAALILGSSSLHAQTDCVQLRGDEARDPIELADCFRDTNQMVRALDALESALAAEANAPGAEARAIAIHARIASAHAALGEYENSREHLLRGIDLAAATDRDADTAALLNDLGGIQMALGEAPAGLAAFADAERLAPRASALRATAGINLTRALAEAGAGSGSAERLEPLRREVLALDDTPTKAAALSSLASLYREASLDRAPTAEQEARGKALATAGVDLARELGNEQLVSYAYLELSEWELAEGNQERALALSREAAFAAQATGASHNLYRAEWASGRILRAMGRQRDARAAYRAAVDTLAATQSALVTSERSFRTEISPLYSEYADVMFAETEGLPPAARRETLVEIQRTLERLRLAEVLNYFENQCAVPEVFDVGATQAEDVLVIYPMLFADRTELLVSAGDEVSQFTADVGLEELTAEVRVLRAALEDVESGSAYLAPAQQIYRWLIEPLVPFIDAASPDAVVFVPDGPLRTIPIGALHDGRQFLIERFAFATTPGLSLIAATGTDRPNRVLANGLIDPVQGFPALPFVEAELRSIAAALPSQVYSDEEFLSDSLKVEIVEGGYTIVHLATHAQFESDYERSFLLTYDDLITMDELEDVMSSQRFTTEPIDLLVLSACQTAAGDERAALGLAGVAVKAGARSALASLWHINDESTSRLIAEFYRQLASNEGSKAEALRGAQLLLMNDAQYRHPAYWAPFLLIGDWR